MQKTGGKNSKTKQANMKINTKAQKDGSSEQKKKRSEGKRVAGKGEKGMCWRNRSNQTVDGRSRDKVGAGSEVCIEAGRTGLASINARRWKARSHSGSRCKAARNKVLQGDRYRVDAGLAGRANRVRQSEHRGTEQARPGTHRPQGAACTTSSVKVRRNRRGHEATTKRTGGQQRCEECERTGGQQMTRTTQSARKRRDDPKANVLKQNTCRAK